MLERIREKGQNLNCPALVMLFSRLAHQKRIIKNEPNFWFYPLKTRVTDVLKENPFEVFTVEEIATKVSLAPMPNHLMEVYEILKELERDGVIEEVLNGQWSLRYMIMVIEESEFWKMFAEKKFLSLLERSPVGQEELPHEIVGFVLSTKQRIQTFESSLQIASETIERMLETGEIIRDGNLVKKK